MTMKPQTNPHLLEAGYTKAKILRASGGKLYLARFGNRWMCKFARRKTFRTANGALSYSKKALARWRRLYDAAIEADCFVERKNAALLAMMEKKMEAHASSVARSEEVGDSSQLPAPIEQESSHERQAETVAEFCERSERPLC